MRSILRQKFPRKASAPVNPRLLVSPFTSIAHSIEEPIEEELLSGDRLQRFHPTQPSQLLDGRFETVVKLGFGTGSTVWLARNLQLYVLI